EDILKEFGEYPTSDLGWFVHGKTEVSLNGFRRKLVEILREPADEKVRMEALRHLISFQDVELGFPLNIPNYTDFYCSLYHATNVGSMFRPDNPLMPNYKYVP